MIRLVYIASPSFSGSTLLTFLLNAHPELATMGELKWGDIDLETYPCSCGQLLRACPFWQRVSDKMAARRLPFDLNRPLTDFRWRERSLIDRVLRARVRSGAFELGRSAALNVWPGCRRRLAMVAAVNQALIEIILQQQNARIFVDASKDPVRLKHLLATGMYDIRVIQLVRDGRGVLNSALKNVGSDPEPAALEWLRTHRQIERLAQTMGNERLFMLRYEDLCRDLKATMKRLFEFIGVEPVDISGDFHLKEHHILGNRMRLHISNEIRLDEKWREMLTKETLAVFERMGGAANRVYGYR